MLNLKQGVPVLWISTFVIQLAMQTRLHFSSKLLDENQTMYLFKSLHDAVFRNGSKLRANKIDVFSNFLTDRISINIVVEFHGRTFDEICSKRFHGIFT